MGEIWKDIEGYEGKYQVSNLGRVRSLNYSNKKGNVRILAPVLMNNGYLYVSFWDKSRKDRRPFAIHRLVAFAFPEICGEWFEGAVVNHKDENKLLNEATNLEWLSNNDNLNYGTAQKRAAQKISRAIKMISKEGELLRVFPSANEAARFLGMKSASHITDCANRKKEHNTCKNFRWEWA